MFKDGKEIVQFLEESWYKIWGMVVAEISILGFCLTILAQIKPAWWLWLVIPAVVATTVVVIWYVTTKIPPKTPKNKVGFLVSIACSDAKELERIAEDFVAPLRRLVSSGHSGDSFQFINLPQRFVSQVTDVSSAKQMGYKCRAHFMIFGRARLRVIGGVETHVIDLDGIVSHQQIPTDQGKRFADEFGELLPRNVQVQTENDVLSFQFTSEWTEVVALYVIGIAAACSGDVIYAEKLYKDAENRLSRADTTFPVYRKLKERLPIRFAELYEHMAGVSHLRWTETHDNKYLDDLKTWLDKTPNSQTGRAGIVTLKAIYEFLHSRNTGESIRLLKSFKGNDIIWHCNLAFLHAYKGDLRQAIRHYRNASKAGITDSHFYQIEDFIDWMVEQEPQKYQLYYCLGFINWQIKGDTGLAIDHFKKFLMLQAADTDGKFRAERTLAEQWIGELTAKGS